MATVSTLMKVEPTRVFEVLADGWQYTAWVVGASHVRAVEQSWPSVGARIHHSFGVWPLVLRDDTTVEVCEPSSRLVLLANGRPLGRARVELRLMKEPSGTRVTMEETVVDGPGQAVPKPVMDRLLVPRNRESLARLAALAELPTSPS
jgi:hypothetical protein